MHRRFAWMWMLGGLTLVAVLYASTGLSAGRSLDVLGELQARGTVTVAPADGSAPLHITDTTYAYGAGDGLRTGEGSAALALADSGGLAFGPGTAAAVDRAGAGVSVSLETGTVAYAVQGEAELRIQAGDAVVTPVNGSLTPVSEQAGGGESPARAGLVTVGEDGQIQVYAYAGRLEVRRGDVVHVVEAGRKASFRLQGGRLIATQINVEKPTYPQWALVLGAIAVAGGITAAFIVTNNGGGGGGGVASP